MLGAKLLTTIQYVAVQRDILVIHLSGVYKKNQHIMMNHRFRLIRVFHLHVDLIRYAVTTVERLRVRVCLIILVGHQIAVQNVQLMPNVLEISLVSTKNVVIHVLAHVEYMQHVIQSNMYLSAFAKMDTLEIHLVDVRSYNKFQLKGQRCHATHRHVEQMQYVKNEMVLALVRVYQNILGIRILDVGQNV
jgi:hypothetical protein